MKKIYTPPEIEPELLDVQDVLRTSNELPWDKNGQQSPSKTSIDQL